MFEVDEFDQTSNTYAFGKGGNQGARGEDSGGDYFVQNVFEELDYPGEFFYNQTTKQLYLWYNGTGAPPADTTFVVPQQQLLVNMTGSQWEPVKGVKLSNIKYTASAATYMERHGVPSAGDWALDRFAAVFLQGTEGVTVQNCTFERLDGNAVMFSGYNRNATVQHSDFAYIGGNAMAAWGYTNETAHDPGRPGVALAGYPEAGVDGTDGEHPRYTNILSNTVREVGMYEKQSSFFIQAKTAQSNIQGNVFFNGPRAGINVRRPTCIHVYSMRPAFVVVVVFVDLFFGVFFSSCLSSSSSLDTLFPLLCYAVSVRSRTKSKTRCTCTRQPRFQV